MPFKIKKTVSSLAPSGNSVLFNGSNQNLRIANNVGSARYGLAAAGYSLT